MKARISVAALTALLFAGPEAFAQDTPAPAQNSQTEVIGPPQLRDFSLNGTVTRQAQPVETEPRPRQQQRQERAPARDRQEESAARPEQDRRAEAAAPEPSRFSPAQRPRPDAQPGPLIAAEPFADSGTTVVESPSDPQGDGIPVLPWLAAALAAAGAAAWYFLRRKPQASLAGVGDADTFGAAQPAVSPRASMPAQPQASPPPPPPQAGSGSSGTVVATSLRPWIDLEFSPERALVDDEKAAVKFQLTLFNSGAVPARDIRVEASLFNAGPAQDQQIQLFFDNPVAKGDTMPALPPLQRVTVETAVFLPRAQVVPIAIEGRPLLVPMIAFNALYSWSGGNGQTSASFLVGRETEGEKLAPFRLDLGSRIFRNLGAREHQLRVRR